VSCHSFFLVGRDSELAGAAAAPPALCMII